MNECRRAYSASNRCVPPQLRDRANICFLAFSSNVEDGEKKQTGLCQDDTDCPNMAERTVMRRYAPSFQRKLQMFTTVDRPDATTMKSVPSRPIIIVSDSIGNRTLMELEKSFSTDIQHILFNVRKKST